MKKIIMFNKDIERNFNSISLIAENWLINKIKLDHPEWVWKNGNCPLCKIYYDSLEDSVKIIYNFN